MKCPECIAQGLTSRVYPGGATKTLLGFWPYYDEAGAYHSHDPNRRTEYFKCGNGHQWTERKCVPCPCPGCEYGRSGT